MSKGIAMLAMAGTLAILANGCQKVPVKGGFDSVQEMTKQRIGKRVEWNQSSEQEAAVAQQMMMLLSAEGGLTMDAAVQIALLNNRRLAAKYEDLGIRQAELVQAGKLRNPRLSGSYLPAVEGSGSALVGLELAADFLDVFFVELRKKIAAAEFDAAKARVTAAVLDTAGATRAAYLDVLGAQQLVEMRQAVVTATDASAEAANKLYDAGNITLLELGNEQAMAGQARLDLAAAQLAARQRREELNRWMGLWGSAAGEWKITQRLADASGDDEPELENLERRAIAANLDLMAQRTEVEAAAKRAGLSNWSAVLSELEVGVAADREDDGVWHVGPSVSLQIPIFDQGQGKKAAAASELRRVLANYEATAVEARSAARAMRDRLVLARQRAEYYRQIVLPLNERIVQQTQLEYNAMQIGVFQLLAAKRGQIDAGAAYIELLREYWQARAQVELLLAGRVSDADSAPMGRAFTGMSGGSTTEGH